MQTIDIVGLLWKFLWLVNSMASSNTLRGTRRSRYDSWQMEKCLQSNREKCVYNSGQRGHGRGHHLLQSPSPTEGHWRRRSSSSSAVVGVCGAVNYDELCANLLFNKRHHNNAAIWNRSSRCIVCVSWILWYSLFAQWCTRYNLI